MKRIIPFVLVLVLGLSLVSVSCSPSYNSIKRMQKIEEGVGSPNTQAELEDAIRKYEKRAMDLVATEEQLGMWYKMLGSRYLDKQMYGRAYESFKKALEYHPDNSTLYYYVGMCAAYIANSTLEYDPTVEGSNFEHKMDYLLTAEEALVRAIKINENNYKAMYTLGVLYIYQLDEPEKAVPYLERFVESQKNKRNIVDGMFALATAYLYSGRYQDSIKMYDLIIESSKIPEKIEIAKESKKIALDYQYSE